MKIKHSILRTAFPKIFNIRLAIFALIMFLACWHYNAPLRQFTADSAYPVSVWVFPFMMSQYTFLLLFYFAVIYGNADIPFMQYSNAYSLVRTGRKRWGYIHLFVLLARAFVQTMIVFFCSVLSLLPRIEFGVTWGKVMNTIAMGVGLMDYDMKYNFHYEIMIKLSPLALTIITILITTLTVFLLSEFIFLISLYCNRIFAIAGAAAYTIMIFYIVNIHPKIRNVLADYTPIVWPLVARVDTPDVGYYWLPSIKYMILVLGLAVIAMIPLIIYRMKHIEFIWDEEDR